MYSLLVHKASNMYLGHIHKDRSYVIGFKERQHAIRVCRKIGETPRINIERSDYENISKHINDGLIDYGIIGLNFTNVTIDTQAILEIHHDNVPLRNNKQIAQPYKILDLSQETLMSFPFEKRVGIIMPETEVMTDARGKFSFIASVLDPVEDIEMFRSGLSME
jgi:hypothetical protein